MDSVLNFIAPHHCYGCNIEGGVCCQKCLEQIADPHSGSICYICSKKSSNNSGICKSCFPKQSLDSLYWYADYSNRLASKIVKSLKFSSTFAAYQPISRVVSSRISKIKDADMVTAAPTANKRVRSRGWDQAKLIAKYSAKANKIPFKTLLLRMSSFDQIGASKQKRAEASSRFSKPIRKTLTDRKVIILVDDIITTGSTLNSAATALKSAGAKEVHAITFARQGLKKKQI